MLAEELPGRTAAVQIPAKQMNEFFFFMYIPCILINIKVFSPTDAQLDILKNNFKFALKFNVNFNANIKLFLRLSNCASVGEKTSINE